MINNKDADIYRIGRKCNNVRLKRFFHDPKDRFK